MSGEFAVFINKDVETMQDLVQQAGTEPKQSDVQKLENPPACAGGLFVSTTIVGATSPADHSAEQSRRTTEAARS